MTGMMAATGLQLNGVSKKFGSYRALNDISISIPAGQLWTILGPSGCGKTTTLNVVAGFVYPDSGSVIINGRDVINQPPFKRGISVVFQDYAIFPHMSVERNIGYGLRMRKCNRQKIREAVGAAIELVRLNGLESRMPSELSGGQRQRVALARSLAVEPSVLLLDEPLSNLDLKLREAVREEIVAIQRRLNITMVLVTHDQTEALTMSNGLVVMKDGHVEQIGSPTEVYERPRTAFVADFIGKMNLVSIDNPSIEDSGNLGREGETLGFRPGDGQLLDGSEKAIPDNQIIISGSLERAAYLGGAWEIYVRLQNGKNICLIQSQPPQVSQDALVRFTIPKHRCAVFDKDGVNVVCR